MNIPIAMDTSVDGNENSGAINMTVTMYLGIQ